jgi:uncharacterized protein DUF2490
MHRHPTLGALPIRLALILLLLTSASAVAEPQASPLPPLRDTQVWTDIAAIHPVSEKAYFFVDGGLRWGQDVSALVYKRVGGGFSIKPVKYLRLGPRYSFIATDPTAVVENREHRLGFEATFFASRGPWTIADRDIVERRFRLPRDSTRYRNRLRLERDFDFSGFSLYAFASDELYYDRAYHQWNRNRFQAGGGKKLSRKLSVEVYYVRQNDYVSRPNNLNGVGLMLSARF